MDLNKLTRKSQEALHNAQTATLRHGHAEVDGEHLLLALLDQPDGLVPLTGDLRSGSVVQIDAHGDDLAVTFDQEVAVGQVAS